MRILLIHNKYKQPGGEDTVFQSESELLTRHGHIVDHLLFDNSEIKSFFDKCLAGLRTIYNPASARCLQERIDQFQPQVIHVHNFVPLVSPSILFVAKRNNIPVVLTLHNYRLICPSATLFHQNAIYEKSIGSFFPLHAILKGVYRNSSMQTAAIACMTAWHNLIGTWRYKVEFYITLTQFAREKFRNSTLSIPVEKLVVKPNFVVNRGKGALKRKDNFLYVGRLTEEKGIRTLLNAAQLHNFPLTIIGDGPLRKLVEDSARTNEAIKYLGYQDREVVLEQLKLCKALIFPSIWYEGFPMTILEAFSVGTVVVASRLGGMAEIIQNRVNGLHFEAGNARDLVARILEMSGQDEWLRYMSGNARLTYLEHYTPEKNYIMLTDIYDQAIASKLHTHSTARQMPVFKSAASF
jgi:glycosyltransferase involved in cell wall biosynthesis